MLRCWIVWKAQFIHKSARIHLGGCSENIDSDKPTDSQLYSEIQSTQPADHSGLLDPLAAALFLPTSRHITGPSNLQI